MNKFYVKISFIAFLLQVMCLQLYPQTWVQKASLPSFQGGFEPVEFSIGGKIYVGGGYINGSVSSNFYQYDPIANTWTPKANLLIPRYGAACFSINGKGYVVAGVTPNFTLTVNMYDPVTDTWTQKNDFPGGNRQIPSGFAINGKGYLFCGFTGGSNVASDMWEYDPTADSWTLKGTTPGSGRNAPATLVINNQVYVGLGSDPSGNTTYTDFYRYDPVVNTYTQVADIPVSRAACARFVIGSTGYVGLGQHGTGSNFTMLDDFYTYTPSSNTWAQVNNFGGVARAWVFSDTIGTLPYVGTGSDLLNNVFHNDNWTWTVCSLGINIGHDTTLCSGSTLSLDATTSGATYAWSTGATTPTISINTSGSYSVIVTQGTCTGHDTINVSFVNPPAAIHLGNDTTYCGNFSRTLSTGIAATKWSTGVTAASITVSAPGLYWAMDSNSCGKVRDSIIISQNPLPAVHLGNDTSLCIGNQAILNATTANGSYHWQNGTTNPTFTVSSAGTYWVAVTVNGCVGRDSIIVNYVNPLSINIGNDTTYCGAFSRTLTTSIPATHWSTNSNAASITVTAPRLYWAKDSNACGTVRDSIVLSENPIPVVHLGNDTSLCAGSQVILNGTTSNGNYYWQDGSNNATFTVSSAGTYWVAVTVNGCVGRDSIIVNYVNPLSINIGNDTTYCGAFSRTLTTSIPATHWSTNINGASITVTAPGLYWAKDSNACGTVRDSIVLSENPIPVVHLGNDTSLCIGNQMTLNVSNINGSYLWQDSSTNPTFQVSSPGTYWVAVTVNGCPGRDSIVVSYISRLSFNIGSDTSYCGTFVRVLSAGIAHTIWSTGDTSTAITVSTPGLYSGYVIACGDTLRDSILIVEKPLPAVDLGNDTTLCDGSNLILNAAVDSGSYIWEGGSTDSTLTVSAAGTYWVSVTGPDGCMNTDSIIVSYIGPPAPIGLGADTTICEDSTLILSVYEPNLHYIWSTGDSSAVIAAHQSGIYSVTVSNACGSATASETVTAIQCVCKIAIPTAFSPNDDGVNDGFYVITHCPLENFELDIYNRWGQKVFASSNVSTKWDGTYRGVQQPLGVYVYTVRYRDPYTGKDVSQAGNVTLLR